MPTSEWAVTTQSVSNQLPGTGHHHATSPGGENLIWKLMRVQCFTSFPKHASISMLYTEELLVYTIVNWIILESYKIRGYA